MLSLTGTLQRVRAAGRRIDTGLSTWLRVFAWPLGLTGLILALVAQFLFDQRKLQAPFADLTPVWLALLSAGLFGLANRHVALESESAVIPFHLPSWPRLVVIGLGLVTCLVAALGFRDNDIKPPELLLWLVGLAICLLAVWPGRRGTADPAPGFSPVRPPFAVCRSWPSLTDGVHLSLSWTQVALLALLALGAFYRLHDLYELPAEMPADLYENYEDMRYLLQGTVHPIFFTRNQGREPMLYYLTAVVTDAFGLSHYSLKLTTALIGLATIPLLYLLARELFNREVGLYAAFWLAVSQWHVSLSRSGISFVLLLLAVIVVMLMLVRALRRGRVLDYALLGVAMGAGLYTYKPAPFIIPAVIVAAVLVALPRQRVRTTLAGLGLALVLTVAVYAPLGAYAITHQVEYSRRIEVQTNLLRQAYARQASPALAFARMLGRSLAMYNVVGDGNRLFNPPYQRQLGFATGALLLVGVGAVLARLWRGFNVLLPVFFGVMLVPLVVAMIPPNDWGNVSYGLGTLAPALIAAALVPAAFRQMALATRPGLRLEFALERSSQTVWSLQGGLRGGRKAVTALSLVFLVVAEARDGWLTYFYAYRDGLPGHNFPLERTMAQDIAEFSDTGPTYIRVWPYWYNGTVVRARLESEYHIKMKPEIELSTPASQIATQLPAGRFMVILNPADRDSLAALEAAIPRHVLLERRDYEGKIAYLMFVGER